jgi:hypothetical protein
MQRQTEHVDRRLEQRGRGAGEERRHGAVGGHERPVPVDGESRVGLVRLEHALDRAACGVERGVVERPLGEHRREPGGDEQAVALAQRDVELLREVEHHLATRLRAARFHEAQMALRDPGLQRQRELTLMAAFAPVAQQRSQRGAPRGVERREVRGDGAGHGERYPRPPRPPITSRVIERRPRDGYS